jgi:hypothetical protein
MIFHTPVARAVGAGRFPGHHTSPDHVQRSGGRLAAVTALRAIAGRRSPFALPKMFGFTQPRTDHLADDLAASDFRHYACDLGPIIHSPDEQKSVAVTTFPSCVIGT